MVRDETCCTVQFYMSEQFSTHFRVETYDYYVVNDQNNSVRVKISHSSKMF